METWTYQILSARIKSDFFRELVGNHKVELSRENISLIDNQIHPATPKGTIEFISYFVMLLLDHDVIKVNHASTKDKMDLIYTVLINHKTIYQSLMTSSPVQAKQIHSEIEKSIVEWTLAKEMPIPNKDLTYKAVESRIRYIANV